ncbi:YigZ family protein [candidate division KSB1 bacterium]|nr:YigZ family protein [candidate division KSB1 bacterium]
MKNNKKLDSYLSIDKEVKNEITVRKSRFIAYINPVTAKETAEEYLKNLRETYRDATHHCYAYVISGDSGETTRSNDDGEPAGTAGKPILNVLQGNNLSNVICVVVRYFGGTKLGMGGLTHAYADAVKSAVEEAKIVTRYLTGTVKLVFSYDATGAVERLFSTFDVTVTERQFGEKNTAVCSIRLSRFDEFLVQFRDVTSGKGEIKNVYSPVNG